jgi:DNA-binding transcriptional LysR family regulator
MQIETFKVFRDLVETTSFSKAAEINGVTQSAVSQQVRAIEQKLRVRLIERGKRYFSLTPEGEAFLDASRIIIDAYESLENSIRQMRNEIAGDLRVATVFSIGLHELPPYLRVFRRAFPAVEVKIEYYRSNDVYAAVLSGNCDVGMVAYPSRRTGLRLLNFWEDKLVMICAPGHRFSGAESVRLADMAGEKFVAFEPDLPTRKEIDRRLRGRKVKVSHILEFDNIETVKRAVEIENAISIVPEIAVNDEVRGGTLVAVEIDEPGMRRPIGALVKSGAAPSAAAKEFLAMLENTDVKVHESNRLNPIRL